MMTNRKLGHSKSSLETITVISPILTWTVLNQNFVNDVIILVCIASVDIRVQDSLLATRY